MVRHNTTFEDVSELQKTAIVYFSVFSNYSKTRRKENKLQLLKQFKLLLMKQKQKKCWEGVFAGILFCLFKCFKKKTAMCHRLEKHYPSTFRVQLADVWQFVWETWKGRVF